MPENDINLSNLRARAFCIDQEMDDWREWAEGDAELAAEVAIVAAAVKRIRAAVSTAGQRVEDKELAQ